MTRWRQGASTHKVVTCGHCGAATVIRRELTGKTRCNGGRGSAGCGSTVAVAALTPEKI